MWNQVAGIGLVLLSAGLSYMAWRQMHRDGLRMAVWLLVLMGLLLRLYLAADFKLHEWDERYHALVAKNMIESPLRPTLYAEVLQDYDYRDWSRNHVWVHKQPLPLWSMALSMSIFGVNELALRLPSVLLSSLAIWLSFWLGMFFYNRKVAYWVAFLTAIQGLLIELTAGRTATDHIDVFFYVFVLWAVYMGSRLIETRKYLYAVGMGLAMGLAILCKWLPALIVLPVVGAMMLDRKRFGLVEIVKGLGLAGLVSVIIFLPWQLYIHNAFPQEAAWEQLYNFKHITKAMDGHDHPFWFHFDVLRMNYGELIYLPCIWFAYQTLRLKRGRVDWKKVALLIWFWVPYLFFSVVKTRMQAYTLFAAPAVLIMSAYFWTYLWHIRNQSAWKWLYYVLLLGLVALPVRFSLERLKVFEQRERVYPEVEMLRTMQRPDTDKWVVFNTDQAIELMFYQDCIAYPGKPDKVLVKELEAKGYHVTILP